MRHFIDIAFRGAPYHGWQVQPGQCTVQGEVERALSTLLRRKVEVVGAGRTDAGVNARRMVAHFDAEEAVEQMDLCRRLNALLGPDIVTSELRPVESGMHARFSASRRTYRYFALTHRSPFLYPLAWNAPSNLDFEAMNVAAELLLSISDFTSFAKLHSDARTNVCRVDTARWVRQQEDLWYFEISADRFLRNMVRAVVGTLVEVGRGKLSLSGFNEVVEAQDRCAAGTSMPAHALFLWDVEY